jgi:hypothetical protein
MRIDSGRTPALTLAASLLTLAASADVVYLKSGGSFSGRIVSRSATSIEIDIGAGRVGIPAVNIARVVEGHSPLQEFEDRASRIAADDGQGWLALGDWADAQGLGTQAREAYNRALSAAPDNARANEAVGNVYVGGRWVGGDEAYRARGYIRFEGQWMTPPEQEAILRERAADNAMAHQRRESEVRAREAEARADEAEARARQAESDAAAAEKAQDGLPLWYGWGAGPTVWPTGPIVVPPVARPLPVGRVVR